LGERISILFRISGDDEHPFSEVTGVLMRVEVGDEADRRLHILRRSGEIVQVAEKDIVKLKMIPAATGPVRPPGAWEKGS
jgi:hypothetical protein